MIGKQEELFWRVMAAITVLCLVALTTVVLRREFFSSTEDVEAALPVNGSGLPESRPRESPVTVQDWPRVRSGGHRVGPVTAPVEIVVFSDFECPFCGVFARTTWPRLEGQFGDTIAMIFRHWPLPGHRYAVPAAIAAECAGRQGRFREFHDAVFAAQRELATTALATYASQAGVEDITSFETCRSGSPVMSRIEADAAEARRIGGRGTPTIVVNGTRLVPPYSPEAIAAHIRSAIDSTVPGKR